MTTPATILTVVLGAAFLAAGAPKALRTQRYRERIRHWRLPPTLLAVIGLVELTGACLLFAGAVVGEPLPTVAGASVLVLTMLGALATHVRIADPAKEVMPAAVLAGLVLSDLILVAI